MSKTQSKNRSELEYVRGQLKAVKRENKQLRKRLNQLEKQAHFYEETIDDVAEDINLDICPKCQKGVTSVIDLKHIIIEQCQQCDYSQKVRQGDKKDKS